MNLPSEHKDTSVNQKPDENCEWHRWHNNNNSVKQGGVLCVDAQWSWDYYTDYYTGIYSEYTQCGGRVDAHLSGLMQKVPLETLKLVLLWFCLQRTHRSFGDKVAQTNILHERWAQTKGTSPKKQFKCMHANSKAEFFEGHHQGRSFSDLKICLPVGERPNHAGKAGQDLISRQMPPLVPLTTCATKHLNYCICVAPIF